MTDKITNEYLAPILAQEDPQFRAFVERFDPKCWARYDLSALRIGWHFARQEAERQMIERCATLCDEKAVTPRNNPAAAAIEYALHDDSPKEFLRCWMYGEFDAIRTEWENVPDEVFTGADHTFVPAAHADNEGEPLPSIPRLPNCGKFYAKDNTGQWHYINHAGHWVTCPPLTDDEELRRDAERYRWLRSCSGDAHWSCYEKDGYNGVMLKAESDLDSAIDAAIAAEKREG